VTTAAPGADPPLFREHRGPMRLDVVMVPNALYGALVHPSLTGHRANTPPGSSLRGSSGSFNHQRDFLGRKSLFAPPSRRIFKTNHSLSIKVQTAPRLQPSSLATSVSDSPSRRSKIMLARKRSRTDTFEPRAKRPSSASSSSLASS
jgi:hypothetical protein